MSNKDNAVAIMQEYFPNGGRDFDDVCSLFDAIAAGKIPGVSITPENEFEPIIRPVIKYLAEYQLPKMRIVATSEGAELLAGFECIETTEYLKG
ncbi:hypothetical protein GMW39_00775 [Pectobacterium parmentieri]|uniref:hypothetical protein n=1 Tax=Pectobacterium parmentieri TaxID=1905730 RepID=UPI0013746585|nr:hypothetical protein [Pectobacterium parmentieri]QHQ14542.1 hypothetical protein GMW39_00775 [Pectobacterium parmentieri]QQA77032.1 hypothetical protein JBL47_05365 [Pectobacterium parmentieri]